MRAPAVLALLLAVVLGACAGPPPQGGSPFTPSPDMLAVLQEMGPLRIAPVETLNPPDARSQPTLQDAARATRWVKGLAYPDAAVEQIDDLRIPGPTETLPSRVYRPQMTKNTPVILYFHGGGFVTGSVDSFDMTARELQVRTKAIVVSVAYREGPEERFPAAQDDASATYRWLLAHAREMGGDPTRIAVAGEGNGAVLALDVAAAARDAHIDGPKHMLLITPIAGTSLATQSMTENARARPLSRAGVDWYLDNYQRMPADRLEPRLDPVDRPDLAGLPAATIILAEIDPNRSSGEDLGNRLNAAGVHTVARLYPGTVPDFFGMGQVVSDARMAEDFAGDRLNEAFRPPYVPPARAAAPVRRRAGYRRGLPSRGS